MTINPDSTSAGPGTFPGTVVANLTPASATYPRNPDGSVNWRAMVRPEHLYVKGEHKEAVAKLLSKPVAEIYNLSAEDIVRVPDKYLVIRKAGILELAAHRGWLSAIPEVQHAQRDYVIVRTLITWAPFESEVSKVSGGVGEACPENTTRLGAAYLAATAKNRAFAIAVRDFLQIDIVCSDELGDKGLEPEQDAAPSTSTSASYAGADLTAQGILTRVANEGGFTFEQVKKAAQSRWDEDSAAIAANPEVNVKRRIENDPAPWVTFKDVPPRDCNTLINLIKAAKQAREAKEAKTATTAASTAATSVTNEQRASGTFPKPGATPAVRKRVSTTRTTALPTPPRPPATLIPISAEASQTETEAAAA